MDANAKKKAVNSGEISISEKKISNGSEVVIKIASEESPSVTTEKVTNGFESNSVPPVSCPSPEPEGARFTRSHTKPPKIPTTNDAVLIRSRSLARSVYSKPKSRFGEPSYNDPNMIVEDDDSALSEQLGGNSLSRTSCNTSKRSISSSRTNSIAPNMSSIASDDEEEIYNKVELIKEKRKRMTPMDLIQWVAFLCNVGCLIKSVQVFIWLALVLVTWVLLFNHGVKRSEVATKVLHYITWTLVTFLIGAFLWLLKTLSLKILASNFHVNRFFDRIQESVFHQYVLQTLSGPPLIEEDERVGRAPSFGQLSIRSKKKGKEAKETKIIDMGKVHKMKQEKVSTWTMKLLVDAIMNSRLSTISNTLDESVNEGEHADMEITNEMEAKAAAYYIFRNVAQHGSKYIEEEDLLRFMIKEEVDLVFPLIEGWENGRIDKKALTNWVLKIYKDRKALGHALDDTKTAVKQLNKLVTGILIVVTILVWLLLSEIATTKVIVVLSTQLVAATFMIGHTCKTIFEAVIFVFVMHPFDVGDRCVVDGIPLLVEEMNILTTIFLKLDNEKISYPNSVLATKSISNYNRSPDMGDTVEFSIAFVTPVERIAMLKEKIKQYLENTPQHWHPEHSVVVKEIENVNKIKFALYCNHTMNFQEFGEKNRRRTELMIELKRIFEELNIEYNLLPQKVHLGNPGMQSTILTGK
uniref:Mechanosensitive ion channel protein n=1 Tax=Citrus unshiu TaxID=55188 RepID=F8WLB4_CITUN|nr:mechanosensitive ion channel domain-containing protein [Citrus unshiu]